MKKQTLLLGFMILAFTVILFAESMRLQTGERHLTVAWTASVIVLASTILWRFWAVDDGRWNTLIQDTNPVPDVPLPASRYLNMMVVAMIVGFVATVSIFQNFIIGAAIYLLMQLCLISAHSGILHLNPRIIRNSPALRPMSLIIAMVWLIITPLIFIFFVYRGALSLVVAPYVVALGLMAAVVSIGLAYQQRPFRFRFLAALGAALFVFSDAIIGHMVFVNPDTPLAVFISPTYVLAIILLSHASLAWPLLWSEVSAELL